jgi:hypothetical protein
MVRKAVGDGACDPDELSNTRTTFLPADLPPPPDFAPARHPREVPYLDLQVAPKNEAYPYGVKLELGDWAYALEPRAVFYGPGWYPFHEHVTRREKGPTAPLNDRNVPTGRTVPARVQLSPDVADFSWGNEYVQLTPVNHRIEARLHLYVGQEQARTLVRTVTLDVDLRARVCPINGSSWLGCQLVVGVSRPSKAIWKAFRGAFQRIVQRRGREPPASCLPRCSRSYVQVGVCGSRSSGRSGRRDHPRCRAGRSPWFRTRRP